VYAARAPETIALFLWWRIWVRRSGPLGRWLGIVALRRELLDDLHEAPHEALHDGKALLDLGLSRQGVLGRLGIKPLLQRGHPLAEQVEFLFIGGPFVGRHPADQVALRLAAQRHRTGFPVEPDEAALGSLQLEA